eukprot:GHVP01039444.1.p2 GENE.GHVP01039444.1~~GHVP01039444.1.p2  ORF type:complete len:520 (-),score=91.60 GHVP01039444.1:1454-3013(-)
MELGVRSDCNSKLCSLSSSTGGSLYDAGLKSDSIFKLHVGSIVICKKTRMTNSIGVIGLEVMGLNLALNFASRGISVAVHNRTASKITKAVERAKSENLVLDGQESLSDFVASLQTPRKIIMMVKAGPAVDSLMGQLIPLLAPQDLLVDGGNEFYTLTEERQKKAENHGLKYLGMGVSGGESGARFGPSLMPGGTRDGYACISENLVQITAQTDTGPCVTYIGPGGSGHYTKMVHNGIEYGDMQLIAEAYDILKRVGKFSNSELHEVFKNWNKIPELQSFLIEITSKIFETKDDKGSGKDLVDCIKGIAGSKGTGKWTVESGAQCSVPLPTINASVNMRNISELVSIRETGAKLYPIPTGEDIPDKQQLINDVRDALYCSKLCSYDQGFRLLLEKSKEKEWNLDLKEIARIWKGGCIIRAAFLDEICLAYENQVESLLLSSQFSQKLSQKLDSWRRVVATATLRGIPVLGMSSSLQYFASMTTEYLPLNLIQAQRDFFGAHTFQRTDCEGVFHANWEQI